MTNSFKNGGDILAKAQELIDGDRQESYGSPTESFQRIAKLWTPILRHKGKITPKDVALCMVLLKVSRATTDDSKEDTWVDMAAYAALGGTV